MPAKKSHEGDAIRPVDETDASKVLKAYVPGGAPEDELGVVRHELEAARRIQRNLLPEAPPVVPGYEFVVHYSPASRVGGDFYDFIRFDERRLGILVADASGKGLSGALLMVEARAVLRTMASRSSSPREILMRTNRVLLQDLQRGMFITIFLAVLDFSRGTLSMASAGHLPMLLWRREKQRCYAVAPAGILLGAAGEEVFSGALREETIELSPGDRFLLYTDGVTELMDPKGEEYGKSRLVACTYRGSKLSSHDLVKTLVADLAAHRASRPPSDDVTIVAVRRASDEEIWLEQRAPGRRAT